MAALMPALNTAMEIFTFADRFMDKETEVMLAGRRVRVSVHGRFHSPLKYVFDCTAVDLETGTTVKAKHYKSRSGATQHALVDLYNQLKTAGVIRI